MKNISVVLILTVVLAVRCQEDLISTILNNANIEEACKWIRDQELQDECFIQLKEICANETFRMRMLDASSKFPYTGMLVRSPVDYGSYDECVELDLNGNITRVRGKYCFSSLIIPTTSILDPNVVDKAYKLATCLPDQCPAKYLLELANLSYIYPLFNDYSCATKYHKPFDWSDYLAIMFFSLISAVILMSTGYDLYYDFRIKSVPNQLWKSFSIFHNGKKLFKLSKPTNEHIQVIHGLRVISTMWIVIGHCFQFQETFPVTDQQFVFDFLLDWKSFYITTAFLSVDTFFFISGMLLAYQFFKMECPSLRNYFIKLPKMILHRYIRLTPVVVAILIPVITIARYIGSGPMYHTLITTERDKCLENWWSFFLYMQNYVNYSNLCLAHTWYLSADWQLFLVSLLVVIPVTLKIANRSFKWMMLTMLAFNVVFTLLPMLMKYVYDDYDNDYETHARLSCYFIGFMLGIYLREKSNMKHRFTNQSLLVIWSCVIVTMLSIVILFKKCQLMMRENDDLSYRLYFIPLRTIWAISLCWVVYACHYGHGGYINSFLTTPLVQILSKLTFCIYLTHGLLVTYDSATSRSLLQTGQIAGIKTTVMVYMMSVVVSTIWTLAFESPIIALESYLFRRK